MPRVKRDRDAKINLDCDNECDKFVAYYTNMGEPYREGIEIGIENSEFRKSVTVMLCDYEAKELRDMLLKHYPID